jgi:CPA2 family monovalent cation:H+ antiporter-2
MTPDEAPVQPKVVIAGFGLPGRYVAETLEKTGVPYAVIELNPNVVHLPHGPRRRIVCGTATDPDTLRAAGIAGADLLALMIPGDDDVLATLSAARAINPQIRAIARTAYTSTGLQATALGNVTPVIAEQLVALEAARLVTKLALKP